LNDFLVRRQVYERSMVSAELQSIIDQILRVAVKILVLGALIVKEGRLSEQNLCIRDCRSD
jgi:hypothetical protein